MTPDQHDSKTKGRGDLIARIEIPLRKSLTFKDAEQVLSILRQAPTPSPGLVEAAEWQPIETAPKDRRILVWPYWSDDLAANVPRRPMKRTAGRWETSGGLHSRTQPTHWRDLPSPPDGKAK